MGFYRIVRITQCAGMLLKLTSNRSKCRSTSIPGELADGVNGNPTDPKLIETLCFTRPLDDWFVQKREQDSQFWKSYGMDFPSMYFGSNNGAFRIYPARHTDKCGSYDPRIRPWYVAGSSGPKNIIMILDTSGSMETRLPLLKKAATRVVQSLTVQDRIAIIPFASTATKIVDPKGYMYQGTSENIHILTQRINDLESKGNTNFYEAFNAAFDVFNTTIDQELSVNCNSAVLFFTDGVSSNVQGNDEVTRLIQESIAAIQPRLLDKPILLFAYSISEDQEVHTFPLQLSCKVDQGVWSLIPNDEAIIESLSSYHQLFALGLGSELNEDFVAWVEPYPLATGNRLGTTVSVPVYDHSRTPHIFLGVVGVDIPLAAIDAALGAENDDSAESISRVVSSSRVICPILDLDQCEMESFRRLSMPEGYGHCVDNCTTDELVEVKEVECPGRPDYPGNYWTNSDVAHLDHLSRTCCKINETTASETCLPFFTIPTPSFIHSSSKDKRGIIVGSIVAGAAVLGGVFAFLLYKKRARSEWGQERSSAFPVEPPFSMSSRCNSAQEDVVVEATVVLASPLYPSRITASV